MKIATLEDDPNESKLIHRIIVDAGHDCAQFMTGQSLIAALEHQTFDLLILDWHLPDMTGEDVIKWVRANKGDAVIVMFLTNRVLEENIVMGLMAGADDYMTKPVREAELKARVYALSKRLRSTVTSNTQTTLALGSDSASTSDFASASAADNMVEAGFYQFDLFRKIACLRGEPVELKPKEFDIAVLLFQNIGQLISREKIMDTVWGRELMMTSRTLDTHMSQVRTKLQLNLDNHIRLTTVYTVGYRLETL